MEKGKKVKKYTEGMFIRLTKEQRKELELECVKLEMNEGTYGRRAITICLKDHLITNGG